jgi:hypothetical protein
LFLGSAHLGGGHDRISLPGATWIGMRFISRSCGNRAAAGERAKKNEPTQKEGGI